MEGENKESGVRVRKLIDDSPEVPILKSILVQFQ